MTITESTEARLPGADPVADPAASVRLLDLSEAFIYARALHLAADLRIADLLADGPLPVADLAEATGTKTTPLYSLLRVLASKAVFTELPGREFALTDAGQPLRSDHPLSVRVTTAQAGKLTARAFQHVDFAVRTGTSAFDKAFGQPVWDYLRENPGEGADFDTAMHEHSRIELAAIVAAYDFTGEGTIVDVGGGDGTLLCEVLKRTPQRTGVLFDLPHVVARNRVADAGLADRCTVVGGDIFTDIPAGGDVYVMKSVLHGWTDEQTVDILRGIRAGLRPGGKLLLVERVVPAGDTPHASKAFDFAMLVMAGGQERTGAEYGDLLGAAGFQVERLVPTGSVLTIVEAVPAAA
jgi:SAM-dependent methyltransferase